MTKIVIKTCYGGFGLSEEVEKRYKELGGRFEWSSDIRRDCPILVQVVEELGSRAETNFSKFEIVELPSGTKYRIQEYDGLEWIELEADIQWDIA
jgi:hypothetical protein